MNNTPNLKWIGLAGAVLALVVVGFVGAGRLLGSTTARADIGAVRASDETPRDNTGDGEAIAESTQRAETDVQDEDVIESDTQAAVGDTDEESPPGRRAAAEGRERVAAAEGETAAKDGADPVLAARHGVMVSNGTMVNGLARDVADRLRKGGVPVAGVGNFKPKPQVVSVLLVTPGEEALAGRVTSVLGDLPQRRHARLQAAVVVVLGEDHRRLERAR